MTSPAPVGTTGQTTAVRRSGRTRGAFPKLGVRACGHAETDPVLATVDRVRALYDALAARPDLLPGPTNDDLFGRLVALAVDPVAARDAAAVLGDPVVRTLLPHLRRLCADGEFELERHWARRIVAHPDPRAELARFPYHANYRDLTRLEYHAVVGLTDRPVRRVLFIGSGPLPLSSMMLAEHHGCAVDNVDIAPEAIALSSELAGVVGTAGLRFAVGDLLGSEASDLDGYDLEDYDLEDYDLEDYDLDGYELVYLAALAGLDADAKRRLLDHLRRTLRPGTLVLARSAHSLRGLLYPVLDPDDLAGLQPLAVVHPHTDVVNSVVVARVP